MVMIDQLHGLVLLPQLFFQVTPPMKMELTECSETSALKIQTPENHPQEIM
jgi:hypothetical protein